MPRGDRTDFRPIGMCVAYEEALGEPFSPDMLRQVSAALPRANAAAYLSALGAALDSPHWPDCQADLAECFLVPAPVADRVKRLITRNDRDCWVHPGMVVAGWRALALWSNADAQPRDDFPRLFTKWLFLLSDAYYEVWTPVFERVPNGSAADLLTEIAFVLQNTWAQHRDDVFYTLCRVYSLLFETPSLLRPQDRGARQQVDQVARLALGGSLVQCVAVGVALWTRWLRLSEPELMEQHPLDAAVVDPGAYFESLGVPFSALGQVLERVSQTFDALRSECAADHRGDPWHPRDLLPIRARPLIAFGPPNTVAYTLPRHVVEAFTTGMYHRLSDHFRLTESRPDTTFRTYWGKLFEAYTGRLLRETFPVGGPVRREVILPDDPAVKGTARFDGVVLYGQRAIVFESVSKPFTVAALTGLDMEALKQDLDFIVLDKVRQLSTACSDLLDGTTELWPGGKRLVPTYFIPVLVTSQGMPLWGPVMRLVDQVCSEEGLFAGVSHDPVQILSVEEFERLLELVWCNSLSLVYVLRERASNAAARDESMDILLHRRGMTRRGGKRHPLLGRSFEELHEAVIRELKSQGDSTAEGTVHPNA